MYRERLKTHGWTTSTTLPVKAGFLFVFFHFFWLTDIDPLELLLFQSVSRNSDSVRPVLNICIILADDPFRSTSEHWFFRAY